MRHLSFIGLTVFLTFVGLVIGSVFGSVNLLAQSQPANPAIVSSQQMSALKAQMDILESQRDLVVVNFPLLAELSENMLAVVAKLSTLTDTHTPLLELLKTDIETLGSEAKARESNAYATANGLQNNCLNCHSNSAPTSGMKWKELPGLSWSHVVEKCNSDLAHGTNPFLCKNMHGLKTMANYLEVAEKSGNQSFKTTAVVAKEIRRIATGLYKDDFVHGGKKLMKDLATEARVIEKLAGRLNPDAFTKSTALHQSCAQCH